MFPKSFRESQTLQLKHLSRNIDTLVDFDLFVQNVQIDSKQFQLGFSWKPLEDLIKKNPITWVYPVRKLCLRFIYEAKIVNYLHINFLLNAINSNCIMEALPVVEAQAVPVKMDAGQSAQYLYFSFLIYFKLGMYQKAFRKISDLITKINREVANQNVQNYVVTYLLFCRCFKQVYIKKQVIMSAFGIDLISSPYQQTDIGIQAEKLAMLQHLFVFASGKEYDPVTMNLILSKLKGYNLNQIYQLSIDQSAKFKSYVQQIKSDKIERLKISSILDKPLQSPQTMRKINKISQIARYDCKQKILYINHDDATQEQINDLITKCFDLNQALKEIKVIRQNQYGFSKLLSLGGLGGLGGLGSFGMRI